MTKYVRRSTRLVNVGTLLVNACVSECWPRNLASKTLLSAASIALAEQARAFQLEGRAQCRGEIERRASQGCTLCPCSDLLAPPSCGSARPSSSPSLQASGGVSCPQPRRRRSSALYNAPRGALCGGECAAPAGWSGNTQLQEGPRTSDFGIIHTFGTTRAPLVYGATPRMLHTHVLRARPNRHMR